MFPDAGKFRALPYPPPSISEAEGRAHGLRTTPIYKTERPTLRIETNFKDTGEEKELFGRRARHIIITTRQIPLEGRPSLPREEVKDGWYIDLDIRTSCEQQYAAEARNARVFYVDQPIENIETVKTGDLPSASGIENWLAAGERTITRQITILSNGARKELISRSEQHITKVEERALDPALFELPPGFTQAAANWHPDKP